MMKLLPLLISFLFVLAFNFGNADAVPIICGEYTGTYTSVVTNCTDPNMNGTYNATLVMRIFAQTGNTFSGTATGTFEPGAIEYIQLTGTISESGQLSGITSHTFLDTGGEGTFTGKLNEDTLSIVNPGSDTYGDTCDYIRTMNATRPLARCEPPKVKILPSDGSTGHSFGKNVSISGDYAIVGSYNSAYIFKRSGNSWNQETTLTANDADLSNGFGESVSISGEYAIVSAPYDDDNGSGSGSAYIFKRSGSSWIQAAKLTASDSTPGDWLGWWQGVSIFGDYAIVGAFHADGNELDSGAAYIFKRSGSSWIQETKLTASDGASYDEFGLSVSISNDYAIVGAFANDHSGTTSGAAYIFKRSGSSWIQVAKLTADDAAAGDQFGSSVSISNDYAIVGAPYDDDNGSGSGSAYIFKRIGSSWTQMAKLIADDAAAGDDFGNSVSLSGDYVIVGAWGDDYNGWATGSAYIFNRDGSRWSQVTKLTASDGAARDKFGHCVSLSGRYAIVGARNDDDNGEDSGSAYIIDLEIPNNISRSISMPCIPLLLLNE